MQAQILDLLAERTAAGAALLLISHDLSVVADLADRVAVMRAGVVVEHGTVAEVLGDPRHPYTKALLAAVPAGRPKGTRLSPPEAGQPVVPGQGAIYFRVADLALAVRDISGEGAEIISEPHLTAPMPDHDLWMAFTRDPDGHLIGLMVEAPKDYSPAA